MRIGERRSIRRGQSQEFADHRPYVAGDDLRFLDWHLYARFDTLWVKLFEEETDRTLLLLLDASASMEGEKLDYARQVGAALSWISLGGGDRVAVAALDARLREYAPPRRGRASTAAVFQTIEAVQPAGETDLSEALSALPRQRGATIALLFTDFLYPLGAEPALRRLLSRGMEVHTFHVLSPSEIRPPIGGDLTLVDAETGEEMPVSLDEEALSRYEATVHAWAEEQAETCRRLGVGYTRILTNVPVEELVLGELRRQGVIQ